MSSKKKHAKVAVLAHKDWVSDQLGGRTSASMQLELESERNKCQGCEPIDRNDAFESALEKIKPKPRHTTVHDGLCACLVWKNNPTLVSNEANVLHFLMTLMAPQINKNVLH